jgi:hypothetical protein
MNDFMVALLNAAARDGVFDGHYDDVANRRILAMRAAQHLDAHNTTRAGIIRDVEIGLHLNHDWMPSCYTARLPRPAALKFLF